ncbi:MAG: 2-oxoacid:acceptor oxidoreductase family protein [Patescibacteria group bacterium]|nr:2-oxoacid:acceptor oxidoreductase family protein [Patescibacteria group bacterium]
MFQLVIHGRGGQGAKTLALMIAETAIQAQSFAQAFPDFGPERTGAPIRSFVRIDQEKIITHEPVTRPDVVIVLDQSLIKNPEVLESLSSSKNPALIINSPDSSGEILKILSQFFDFKGRIHVVDALAAVAEFSGKIHPTVPIIGKLIKITEIISLDDFKKTYESKFLEKLGEESIKQTLKTLEDSYYGL